MSDFNKCDVCGKEGKDVKAGRWIFYCPAHKSVDEKNTFDNEIAPDLESGELGYIANDGELQEVLEKHANGR